MKKYDYALMNILRNNWDSPLEYVVSLLNASYNTNFKIFFKKKSYSILTIFFEKTT